MPDNDDRTLADQIFGDQAVKNDEIQTDQIEQTTQTQAPAAGDPESGKTEPQKQETEKQEQTQAQEEKLLAGKYKTPEELESAYIEGQKWWTRSSQEVGQLRRDLEDLQKQVAPDMTKQQQADFKKQMQAAVNMAVIEENPEALQQLIESMVDQRTEAKIKDHYRDVDPLVAQSKLTKEVNVWLGETPEAAEHLSEMQKLLDAEPNMIRKPGWLDKVYAKVLSQKMGLVKKVKIETAAQTQAEKQAAAIAVGGARPLQTTETEVDKIKKGIFGGSGQKGIFDD